MPGSERSPEPLEGLAGRAVLAGAALEDSVIALCHGLGGQRGCSSPPVPLTQIGGATSVTQRSQLMSRDTNESVCYLRVSSASRTAPGRLKQTNEGNMKETCLSGLASTWAVHPFPRSWLHSGQCTFTAAIYTDSQQIFLLMIFCKICQGFYQNQK